MNAPAKTMVNDAFVLTDSFSHRLNVTARRVAQIFARRYAAECHLNTAEWRVLAVIAAHGAMSPSQVGVAAEMDKVKVSRAVATLVQRNLVRQVTDSRDGRMRVLTLTRKGITSYSEAAAVTRELEATLAESMNKADWAALRKTLGQLDAHAARMSGGGGAAALE